MIKILDQLQLHKNWKDLLRQSCKFNQINTSLAGELTILKLRYLSQKFQKSLGQKVATSWIQNQLKAFNWLLIAISSLKKIKIIQFDLQQWQNLSAIFQYKSCSFLKFEAKRLVNVKIKKNKNWTEYQDNLLKQLIKKDLIICQDPNKIQWNQIARNIFQISNQTIFRTGKHCRQRWLNYLDPTKMRGQWSKNDDIYLLSKVNKLGKKWSQYASQLKRTQHTVKNRYNSLLMKQKKATPHIHKQQKLISQMIKKLIQIKQTTQNKLSQVIEQKKSTYDQNELKIDQINNQIQQNQQNQQNQQKIQNPSLKQIKEQKSENNQNFYIDVQKYVKEDHQVQKYSQCQPMMPHYSTFSSPFWGFSPTPNNFMNSPSPSFHVNVNYTFASMFTRFTSHISNINKQNQNDF